MEDVKNKLEDVKFHNWIKSYYALDITKGGIKDFVCGKINDFHKTLIENILSKVDIENKNFCTSCCLQKVLPCPTDGVCSKWHCQFHVESPHAKCPKNICNQIKDRISAYHETEGGNKRPKPAWRNTSPEKWCEHPWEIAKCFMLNLRGYEKANSFDETDFFGVLSIIRNHVDFRDDNLRENCKEVQQASNEIRHHPRLLLDETQLSKYLTVFKTFLQCVEDLRNDSKTAEAIDKLDKLEKDRLVIIPQNVVEALQHYRDQHTSIILDIQEKLNSLKEPSDNMTTMFSKLKETEGKNRQVDHNPSVENDFLEDLMAFYESENSTMLMSPHLPGTDVDIISFYVTPQMVRVDWGALGTDTKYPISSYDRIFGSNSNAYRNIYISAQAGLGKTTFAKRLCSLWCIAKAKDKEVPLEVSSQEIKAMEQFDFVFLILLRDVQLSDVDEMIRIHVINRLSRSEQYGKQFVENILHNRRCLVILDGLDEWRCSSHNEDIPQRKARPKCTILTTTRPWKMYELDLGKSKVNNFIEMSFSDESVKALIYKVMEIFAKDENKDPEKIRASCLEFIYMIQENHLQDLICTPIILIQLVCLWLDRREKQKCLQTATTVKVESKSLGQTKCEIFINVIEFILRRAEKKYKTLGTSKYVADSKFQLPVCFSGNELCEKYAKLLTALGKLACHTLFKTRRAASLVFRKDVVQTALYDPDMLNHCLRLGLLSESKSSESLSTVKTNYSFIHKTFQEFFCALHLQSNENDPDLQKVCPSIAGILDMATVFIFLGGLNRKRAVHVLKELTDVLNNDPEALKYRSRICTAVSWRLRFKEFKDFQNLVIECEREGKATVEGQELAEQVKEDESFTLADLIIDNSCKSPVYKDLLKNILSNTQLISVRIYDYGSPCGISGWISFFQLTDVRGLQKIDLIGHVLTADIDSLIMHSVDTLKCLSLCLDRIRDKKWKTMYMDLTTNSINYMNRMQALQSLMLECIRISHEDLQRLLQMLGSRIFMKQINLAFVQCKDDGDACEGFELDLSQHTELDMLQLGNIPLNNLHIFPDSITLCRTGSFRNDKILPILLDSAKQAKQLRSFMCFDSRTTDDTGKILNAMQFLTSLQTLVFKKIEILDDNIQDIHVPQHLKRIKLAEVSMSMKAFEVLVEQLKRNEESVGVEILDCHIVPKEDFEKFKLNIRSSNSDIWFSDKDTEEGDQFMFTVRKH